MVAWSDSHAEGQGSVHHSNIIVEGIHNIILFYLSVSLLSQEKRLADCRTIVSRQGTVHSCIDGIRVLDRG